MRLIFLHTASLSRFLATFSKQHRAQQQVPSLQTAQRSTPPHLSPDSTESSTTTHLSPNSTELTAPRPSPNSLELNSYSRISIQHRAQQLLIFLETAESSQLLTSLQTAQSSTATLTHLFTNSTERNRSSSFSKQHIAQQLLTSVQTAQSLTAPHPSLNSTELTAPQPSKPLSYHHREKKKNKGRQRRSEPATEINYCLRRFLGSCLS